MDSSEIVVAHHSSDGNLPFVNGVNAISKLSARSKLETIIFVSCIFKTGALQEDAMGNNFDGCS